MCIQWTNEASLTTGSPAAILVRSYAAIPESCIELANVQYDSPEHLDCISGASCIRRTVLVGAVGLLGPGLVAVPLGDGLGGVGSIALAMPHNGLLDCPCWGVGRPVGVELWVIACGVVSIERAASSMRLSHTQQLINVLQSQLAIVPYDSSDTAIAAGNGNAAQTRACARGSGAHLGNYSRHLGGLERLSRFSRLDAQSAEREGR